MNHRKCRLFRFVLLVAVMTGTSRAADRQPLAFDDPQPQRYTLSERASTIDPRVREYPEIDFVFEAGGKVQDTQHAIVDTQVQPRGKLVIWLMGHNGELFDRLADYGLHAIQVHYANRWFSKLCQEDPVGEMCRGNVRLEAATGEDYSDQLDLAQPDGMKERAYRFVKWLARENPQGKWESFLTDDGEALRWDDVIMAGSSHGSTTSARFALHQKVGRVVMFCGPRDQYQNWQKLPSATPTNRFFSFSHVLDRGWVEDHYCRSWELLGLHNHGPIIDVDEVAPPFDNSRRLITRCDVGGDPGRAHSSVVPGRSACKNASGEYVHEPVWRYLFTHPIDKTGQAVPMDDSCEKQQRP